MPILTHGQVIEALVANDPPPPPGRRAPGREALEVVGRALRRRGVVQPGRYAETVPPRLRALGVTGRELQVLKLVAQGLGNAEIAGRLQLSRRTVETHVSSLLLKTGARSREGLVELAP